LSPKTKDSVITTDLNDLTRKVQSLTKKKSVVVLVIETNE
jgi:hypothetical protein